MDKNYYSLVVVDDEAAIRKGICNYIDWNAMGFEVAADFEDGKETIEYLREHPADVVLTDVQMAQVSGLAVARYVFENGLPTKVVIISGYKEFEYAKQAIAYNVSNYILKPIHMDELAKTFGQIREQLQEEQEKQKSSRNIQQDLKEILPELQEQFWMSILLGGLKNRANIIEKRELLHLKFSTRTPCAVVDVKLNMDRDMSSRYFLAKDNRYNLLNNIFSGENQEVHFYPVYLSQEQLKVVVTTSQEMAEKQFEEILTEKITQKTREVRTILGLDMEITVEGCFSNFTDLAEHYYSRQTHVQRKNEKEYTLDPEDYERLQQKYQLLMDTINNRDFEALERLLANIMFEFRNLPLNEVKSLLIDMFSMLMQKLMKISPELWREVKETVEYTVVLNASDRGQVQSVCSGLLRRIMEIVDRRQTEISKNLVERVMDYVKQNYNQELSLDQLAERYYLNSAYLSRLFKQYTGMRFTDYLIELRMEKSKELLLTGKYKVYEVSQKMGYKSDKYFFRVFKQYTGQSPSEFCRSRTDEKTK